MSDFRTLLTSLRDASRSEREKGTYFERLAVAFLKNDPGMQQEYEDVWLFSDWAKANRLDGRDIGIDAVAKIRGEDSFCAVQCKFYAEGYRIQKGDIDSFLSSSQTRHFSRGLIIDTTGASWSPNAEALLDDLNITRIGLDRLEASPIDWASWVHNDEIKIDPPKEIRLHQREALEAVRDGLAKADRGKLIMACGTGKTFTGLKIAEELAGVGKTVLFMVPSLALMSQTIREWTIDAAVPIRAFAVCSDVQVGKRRKSQTDVAELEAHDLDYPATTSAAKLASRAGRTSPDRMTVVFATYQSIQVLADAQRLNGLSEFDLIICDEAHRTTGATLAGDEESNFVRIHDQSFVAGRKRLYMTATPRVFGEAVRERASEADAVLCSMDDEQLYGETLFARGFGWAVENQLLTDYKVLVLAVDEGMVSTGVQRRLADDQSELKLDDATKIIGCYKALTKQGLRGELVTDPYPMKRALAFCRDINSSKMVQSEFSAVVAEYLASDEGQQVEGDATPLDCQLRHVDGTFNAKDRNRLLDWLKEEHGENACRILTNARCLSEGVDVPALDAILFMHPRKSQIDVVQSVGRVMRRSPGKNMGYVILPIGVPAGMTPEDALNDNERYRVVWQILNALRSHDERFDAMINKADLGVDISDHIEVIAVSNKLPTKKDGKGGKPNIGHGSAAEDDEREPGVGTEPSPTQPDFFLDEFSKAIMAKIVKKCGRRDYWEDWAGDIAKIAQTHITRITALVEQPGSAERAAFEGFLGELRDDLNDSITEGEAIEMLAQHLITKPVFDALFEGYSFAQHNPVSRAMQAVLEVLDEHSLEKETESLQRFYASVKRRAEGIDRADAKQKIVVELYDKFFRNAFPKMTERLGIVYTPVEVVDFIIHSVNEVLQAEFGQTVGSRGVHIMDPFTGTGTFITRLLQSGLIKPEELEHKYRHEIHANEIVLLAYYIAAINIEAAYHGVAGGDYVPFEGICLTDTFQLYEQERDLISDLMADNSSRRSRQKELDIRVIVGNPPYSVGQDSDNNDAANVAYPKLDKRIQSTYVAHSTGNPRSLYDSYIRAIRWASDRIGDAGVVAYVSNAGWLDGKAADGLRKCLAEEFSGIDVFHLRGNQRTSGEKSKREGGKIFGSGSRTPVAITVLTKNPKRETPNGRIRFHDIGDYLTREQKLAIVSRFGSVGGIESAGGWQSLTPDEHSDWVGQRDGSFQAFPPLGAKRESADITLFENYSAGVKTNRDPWAYNSSEKELGKNMSRMIGFYRESLDRPDRSDINDEKSISWSWVLRERFAKRKMASFDPGSIVKSIYRPFSPQMLYYDGFFNENRYLTPKIFPTGRERNRAIYLTGPSAPSFSVLMIDAVPCLDVMSKGQCFPRFLYDGLEEKGSTQGDLLSAGSASSAMGRDAITNDGLAYFQASYPRDTITKDDLFHYVYGLLHSENYRSRFADNLSKQLPRIPAVKNPADFWAFVEAGRRLGDLHCEFDSAEPYPVTIAQGDLRLANIPDPEKFYRVEKMKFGGKRPNVDKTTVIYNSNITMTNIPLAAYDYVVNGKPALEWVMERQGVKTDKASGIVNDANRYAIETVGDPAYPLKLFQRVITVSLETMKIVRALPPLDIAEPAARESGEPVA
ncbi:MAG: DEAD/DEAH box helicase family protein [Phenylobacterium sp.]|uniref:DEAD/DEAH box helicase n=1 Tax=Phenylobacterium sp. TaxID=1871053 RepID=UPI0025DE31E8|nr:type ISP restriction/modification enzyme [Phenylobacterium sp.]MCG9915437.1 DEAD/DEAH box helicase family protein [Phenylobacterium sp.]